MARIARVAASAATAHIQHFVFRSLLPITFSIMNSRTNRIVASKARKYIKLFHALSECSILCENIRVSKPIINAPFSRRDSNIFNPFNMCCTNMSKFQLARGTASREPQVDMPRASVFLVIAVAPIYDPVTHTKQIH